MNRIPNQPPRELITTGSRMDPLRWAVQASLAVYLLPVLLMVLFVGVGAMIVGGAARVLRSFGLFGLDDHPAFATRPTRVRQKAWLSSVPHHQRSPALRLKNRSA
jgi:hypothetical protein